MRDCRSGADLYKIFSLTVDCCGLLARASHSFVLESVNIIVYNYYVIIAFSCDVHTSSVVMRILRKKGC